jgi:hypothetical protein
MARYGRIARACWSLSSTEAERLGPARRPPKLGFPRRRQASFTQPSDRSAGSCVAEMTLRHRDQFGSRQASRNATKSATRTIRSNLPATYFSTASRVARHDVNWKISLADWKRSRSQRPRRQLGKLRGSRHQSFWPARSAGYYPGLLSPKPQSRKRRQVRCWSE